jgi:hypothetical protein|tara:strand:- start:513 stop:719 length:207 start_codon:yes stop_codon:yes gene_type:complete
MAKNDIKQDKAMVKAAVHKHEKGMHPGKPMTKLAKGGKTNMQMKDMGRGLAKVANQKKSVRSVRKAGI